MERRAINSSGRVGSYYDACHDRLTEVSYKSYQEKRVQSSELPQCRLINGNTEESNNLLRWMGIEDELRLSLLLRLTKRNGIGAILDYSHPINEYTRFLYYSLIFRKYQLEIMTKLQETTVIGNPSRSDTHMVTAIHVGIDVLVVLQLPSDTDIANRVDLILHKICDTLLKDENNTSNVSTVEHELLEYNLRTTVFSNIAGLTYLDRISHVLQHIETIKKNITRSRPVYYTLQSNTALYPIHILRPVPFQPLPTDLGDSIENYMLQMRNKLKYVDVILKENATKVPNKNRQDLFNEAHPLFSQMKDKYMKEMQRFAKLIAGARSNPMNTSEIRQALRDNEEIILEKRLDGLIQHLQKFKIQDSLMVPLKLTHLNAMERRAASADPLNRILKSSATFKVNNLSKSTNLRQSSVEKDKNQPVVRPASADFSSSLSKSKESFPPSSDTIINILLLGETGVGKSTFINAFANHLTFTSLEHAQFDEPIVVIPSSFTMTIGDNFEERTVKFGDMNSSDNEYFNNLGHSVTQYCRSYVFDLKDNDKKLRIIDTPGFGDIRGIEQDDQNMEHILQYINHLNHLNAICFLLKPNLSRLNIFFRICLTQLFPFLGPTARENVIFCFTNARSTFPMPGDTSSLFQSLAMSDVPLKKENTFFVNHQWFRYLVALQNSISFTKDDQHKYEMTWSTSVREFNRLIEYVDRKLCILHLNTGWQSIKHAQFEISQMIRPILEAMRNILRNIILSREDPMNKAIELHSKALHRTAARCLSCSSNPSQVEKFWVASISPHEIRSECLMCSCTPAQHVPMNYLLQYQCSLQASSCNQYASKDTLDMLCNASAEFTHFLMHVSRSTNDDPFFIGLVEMIAEERCIIESQPQALFNIQLIEELRKLIDLYEQRVNQMQVNQDYSRFPAIYKLIKTIDECPLVHEQLVTVKKTKQMIMKQQEDEARKICYTCRL